MPARLITRVAAVLLIATTLQGSAVFGATSAESSFAKAPSYAEASEGEPEDKPAPETTAVPSEPLISAEQEAALREAGTAAKETAESKGFRAAIANAWRVMWEKAWPALKGMFARFFSLLGSSRPSVTTQTNASVNAPAADAPTESPTP